MPVPQVLVAGSGVAELEVVTALHALAGGRVAVKLLTDSALYLETVNDGAVYDGPDDPTAIPVGMHLPTKPAAPFAAPA